MADGPGAAWEQGSQTWICSPNLVPCLQRPLRKPSGPHFWTCSAWMHDSGRYSHIKTVSQLVQVHESVKESDHSWKSVLELGEVKSLLTFCTSRGWTPRDQRYQCHFTYRGVQACQDSLTCGWARGERRRMWNEFECQLQVSIMCNIIFAWETMN